MTPVLTFNYVSWGGNENEFRWNCTGGRRARSGRLAYRSSALVVHERRANPER
jgi:hypothetical protein